MRWFAWYRPPAPYGDKRWIGKHTVDGDTVTFSTLRQSDAFKFESREEAKKSLPTYDGSSRIEERTGVEISW